VFFNNADNGALGNFRINIDENPFVTQQIRDLIDANVAANPDLDPLDVFFVSRSNIDIIGDSPNERSQDVFRFVFGLEGDFDFGGTGTRRTTLAKLMPLRRSLS